MPLLFRPTAGRIPTLYLELRRASGARL